MVSSEGLAKVFVAEARHRLAHSVTQIKHSLDQLDEHQVWWRPGDAMNSIANLVLHVCGNLRQWIVSGVGGEPDIRARQEEFSLRGGIPTRDLIRQLDEVVEKADGIISALSPSDLVKQRRIQGFDTNGLSALFNSLGHLQGHTQEIIHLTREHLGDDYKFHWAPTTAEDGAAH